MYAEWLSWCYRIAFFVASLAPVWKKINIDRHLALQKDTHWVGTLLHILVKAVILF